MRLIACQNCHTQYDVSQIIADTIPCRCGETLANKALDAVDATIHRCGACGAQVNADTEACDYCGSTIVRDAAALSLICPECFARNADASRFCTACGVAFAPEPIQVSGHELPCPACGPLMPPTQVAGLSLNECASCNGLWVPGDNFHLLITRAAEARRDGNALLDPPRVKGANPSQQSVQYRKCPECDVFMLRRNYQKSSGVIIDRCAEHGTWLDADELEQIAGFILSGGETSPVLKEEHQKAQAEAAAAAAMARARIQVEQRGLFDSRPRSGGLVGMLLDILS